MADVNLCINSEKNLPQFVRQEQKLQKNKEELIEGQTSKIQ